MKDFSNYRLHGYQHRALHGGGLDMGAFTLIMEFMKTRDEGPGMLLIQGPGGVREDRPDSGDRLVPAVDDREVHRDRAQSWQGDPEAEPRYHIGIGRALRTTTQRHQAHLRGDGSPG